MLIEVLSGLKRKATFLIKKEEVNNIVQDKIKNLAKTAKVQGFRPGKAPIKMLEQIYGGQSYEDVLNEKVRQHFIILVNENNLEIAGMPDIELANSDDKEFTFTATFEVMPEIKFGDFASHEVEKPICSLSDVQIDAAIEAIRKHKANYVLDDSKEAAEGDKVIIDFVGSVDGKEFAGGTANDYTVMLGQKNMLPDFENGIIGMKVHEVKDIPVHFPSNYHAADLQDKTANFKITLKSLFRQELPELTEEFIKSIGVSAGNIEAMKNEIRDNLTVELNRRIDMKYRDNLLQMLIASTPIEVPYALVHDQIHVMMNDAKAKMQQQGYPDDQIKLTHEMFEVEAKRFVTLRLLLQQLVKDNQTSNIGIVTDAEIKDVVKEDSQMYDDSDEFIKWYYQDPERVQQARAMAIEKKVINFLATKALIKEVVVSYEDLLK